MKTCKHCNRSQKASEYRKIGNRSRVVCRACERMKRRNGSRAKYNTPFGRVLQLCNVASQRGQRKAGTISRERIMQLAETVEFGTCPLLGVKFDMFSGSPFAPSLDRIDSRKPYSDENVRIVTTWANKARGELSDDVFSLLCARVVQHKLEIVSGSTHASAMWEHVMRTGVGRPRKR